LNPHTGYPCAVSILKTTHTRLYLRSRFVEHTIHFMRIALRRHPDDRPTHLEVDPAGATPTTASDARSDQPDLIPDWPQTIDDQGHLSRCPACGCRELFARKDFPQKTGLAIVILGAAGGIVCFVIGQVVWGLAALGGTALLDLMIYPFTKRCLVCYRCRSEFRDLPISNNHPGWDLATGEKYRQSHIQANPHPSGSA